MKNTNTVNMRVSKKLHNDVMLFKLKFEARSADEVISEAIRVLKKYMKEEGYTFGK